MGSPRPWPAASGHSGRFRATMRAVAKRRKPTDTCDPRSRHEGRPTPHLFTSRRIVRKAGVVVEDVVLCSWCGKVQP